ncbi:MAG TPA: NAD+ synthase [Bdellovibrionota bacterium]|nr:NAD+ synthase [Bdellovibrionota bacterium]
MRVALAQINTSTGAIDENCKRIDRYLKHASVRGAELVVFPELAIVGYPPKDLLDQDGFVRRSRQALDRLAADHPKEKFIVGFVDTGGKEGKGRANAAAYVEGGKIQFIHRKVLLPNYDVFDEVRYFDAGRNVDVVKIGDRKIGITICEDIWNDESILGRKLYGRNPAEELKQMGAELIINISASPYHDGKEQVRRKLVDGLIEDLRLPILLVNLVGGNDELLFDGGSFAADARGKIFCRAKVFEEDLVFMDLDLMQGEFRDWPEEEQEWMSRALVMGLRDYARKCGFQKVVVGLSGGIDSSLVALLAVEALGPKNVMGVSMPSRFTSPMSREDAESLAKKLGIEFLTLPIDPIAQSYEEALSDAFSGKKRDVTEENIQARVRGNLLMALSNKFGSLVLSTGNKSELAVGYCTQYGDMAGGLAVISDLPKEKVYKMARHLNRKWNAIAERVFTRPPSAELRPNQKDEDSLPPYSVLDPILRLYVEEMAGVEEIMGAGFDRATVQRVIDLVDRNEFKRRQAAPGLRLSAKAFGVGRRMPIARGSA